MTLLEDVVGAKHNDATRALVDTYAELSEEPAAGLAAIHAYERQVPAVAGAKIAGLREHYGVDDDRALAFWRVHEALDVAHADAEREILAGSDREQVVEGTRRALDAWWTFLDALDVPA